MVKKGGIMMIKESVLKYANGHVRNNLEIRENAHKRWKRCWVLADNKGDFPYVFASKKGAESKLKQLINHTYYDDYQQKMVSSNKGYQIVKVELTEILPLDSLQLWYNTLWNEYRMLSGRAFNFNCFKYIIKKNNLPDNLLEMIRHYGEMAEKGEFDIIKELEKDKIDLYS